MNRTKLVGGAFLLLLLNSGWVWAFPAPNLFYIGNVLAHIGLGLALLVVLWLAREPLVRRLRSGSWAAYGALTLCGVLGLVLARIGATRPHMNVVLIHGAAGFLGAAILAWWAWRNAPRLGKATAAALVIALALPGYAWIRDRYFPRAEDHIVNPLMPPESMYEEGPGKDSPFFPSSSDTNTGDYIPSGFFLESEACKECHADIYNQWHSSAHHFSSFNNQFYRKSIELMQETAGIEASKWCAACHDHAMFFNGRFEKPVIGQIDTQEAHAGLGCMSCHSMVKVNDTMGNSGFVMEYPKLHGLAMSKNPIVHTVQKYVTNIAPAAHRRAFLKPFMKTSEYCSACHKVHLDAPVNDYRWLRGFNEYDSWQASGVSGQGARSFYYPPASKSCADCHMPLTASNDKGNYDGQVHSHRFPAANTALPHVNHDAEQLRTIEDFLENDIVGVDIFAVSPADAVGAAPEMVRRAGDAQQMATTFGVGEESASRGGPVILRDIGKIAAPVNRVKLTFAPGDRVKVDVVVRTKGVGHFFPGGTVDAVDCWVELRGKDATGRDIFRSGGVEQDGPVDPGAHFYRSVMLDEHGNLINKRNAFQTRSLLYARLIPPGAADVSHYIVEIPAWAEGPIRLEAQVHYRKFSRYYTEFSYAGKAESDDKALYGKAFDDRPYTYTAANIPQNVSGQIKDRIPDLPITTLAKAQAELELGPGQTEWRTETKEDDAVRWNDYGIGLLLQGDLKGAEYAFTRVTEAKPEWADGWLNVARTLIEEGQTDTARPWVEKALERGPDLARVHYFYAQIFKSLGEYDQALHWLGRASATYPKDRVVLNDIGRILFLQKKYSEAVGVLNRVARIDPEDLQMHYTRMLCYRGLGELDLAAQEEKLFRRFKADEAAQMRTAEPRRRRLEDNNERQAIHDHVSAPLAGAPPLAGGADD